jgi:hypothetical protein
MSIVNRAQFAEQVTVSLPDAALTTFDIPRPVTTPAEPPYAEGADHVIRDPNRDELYGGEVTLKLPTTLVIATAFLRMVEIRKLLPATQKGLAGTSSTFPHPPGATPPIFPTGAASDSEHVRYAVQEAADSLAMDSDAVAQMLGMEVATSSPGRSYPGITLRAGEYVRLSINVASGGPLNSQVIGANYNMGESQSTVGRP